LRQSAGAITFITDDIDQAMTMKKIIPAIVLAILAAAIVYYAVAERDFESQKSLEAAVTTKSWPGADSVGLPALMRHDFDGRELAPGRILDRNEAYTRYYITYRSGPLRISGIMNVPHGKGPFPVVLLNHGYIPPVIYTNGRGLKREQDYLARRGYVVIHPDYRNHAESDKDSINDFRFREGYTVDVINAIYAVRNSDLPYFDKSRIGMMGHSMGGGIAMNVMVSQPELVQAVVLYASVSGDIRDNFYRWMASSYAGSRILQTYGSPSENPDFWREISAMHYFSRTASPVLIHHGTSDESCPVEWSDRISDSLKAAGKSVEYFRYEKERHELINRWPLMMLRTATFFDTNLKKKGS
jgi:dipeptidyl aminopeptidase/acylaminoacyl peptidase